MPSQTSQLKPFGWTNATTREFVRWLVEDVAGAEFVSALHTVPSEFDLDTPTYTLGETIREAFVSLMPVPVDPRWIEEVDWNQTATYLIQHGIEDEK